jgi:hypothetical protein
MLADRAQRGARENTRGRVMRLEVGRAIGEVGHQQRAEPDPQRREAAQVDREDPRCRDQFRSLSPRSGTKRTGISCRRSTPRSVFV